MKRDKQQSTFVNIGSSSLLIIFLVLSLTTFAILSLSSAQSDYSFSKRLAEHKTEYYEASSRAELILGEIDRILAETANSGADAAETASSDTDADTDAATTSSSADAADTAGSGASTGTDAAATSNNGAGAAGVSYAAALTKLLDGREIDGVSVSCINSDGKILISYEVPSGEKQALRVTLLVTDAAKEDYYYKIEAWQLISTSDWNADDTIQLMPMQ